MAIPTSGVIALTALQTEFGGSNPIGINEYYRGGGLVPDSSVNSSVPTSGAISMNNFYGAQNRNTINITISASTNNYNLFSNLGGEYIAGLTNINVTINNGVTIGSSSTGSSAFTISGFTSGDVVSLVNNGTIVGKGGAGANGGNATSSVASTGSNGSNGGTALSVSFATNITNNGIIAGGGGGGGGGGRHIVSLGANWSVGGGGGGGGAGSGSSGSGGTASGSITNINGSAGTSGTSSSEGNGGTGATATGSFKAGNGGNGGSLGSSGSSGTASNTNSLTANGGTGGSSGNYVSGNSNVTWVATGTRLGGVS